MSDLFYESRKSSYGNPSPSTGGVSYGTNRIASPYLDFATYTLPRSFSEVIDWSEYVATLNDDLFRGIAKLYGYFATDIRFLASETTIKPFDLPAIRKWQILLEKDLNFQLHEHELGLNVGVYGNDFITITLQPQRMVTCPICNWSLSVKRAADYPDLELKFNDMKFVGYCQGRCKGTSSNRKRQLRVDDYYVRSASSIVIKHWPIRELDFDYLEANGQLRVYWKIPQRVKDAVLKYHDPDTLHDLDMSVLESICQNKMLRFDERSMFHAKEPVLSGLRNRGLGIPRTLSLGRQHWLVQLLKKQCQALASSYVVPMEFFSMASPTGGGGVSDPFSSNLMDEYAAYISTMIEAHQKNPTHKYFVPFPITHQIAGANANQYVPVALMEYAQQELTNSLVPDAMLKGDMTVQASSVFLKMFESTNRAIPAMYNRFLWFTVDRVAELLQKEAVWAQHERISVSDNLEIDAALQGGALNGKNSDYAWQQRMGIDGPTEASMMLYEAKQQLEFQRAMDEINAEYGVADQTAQMATDGTAQGGPDGQGAPAGGGEQDPNAQPQMPGQSMLLPSQGFKPPDDIAAASEQAAAMAQILGSLPPPVRASELQILRTRYDAFHKLVTSELEKLRNQTSMQARQQLAPNL